MIRSRPRLFRKHKAFSYHSKNPQKIKATPTPTPTLTPTNTPTPTPTLTPTATPTLTPTLTPTPSVTPVFVPFGLNWILTSNNPCDPEPWVVSQNNTSLRYNITDSMNCGGTCDATQSGTATATITVGPKDVDMYLAFSGIGELEDPNYERIEFELDGTIVARGRAPGGRFGCQMGPIVQEFLQPSPYRLLQNTTHTFIVRFNTVDELFHVGAYYQINLSFAEL